MRYYEQIKAYRIIVRDLNKPKPLTHPGEDIRCAKAIFEDWFGEQTWIDVNLWLELAHEAREYFGLKTIQETADFLEIKYRKLI